MREYYAKTDKAHAAAESPSTSIIEVLEVVQSDFSKDLVTIESTEEEAQSNYETQTYENDVEKAMLQHDEKCKTKESAALDKAVAETSSDRATVQAELNVVKEYLTSAHLHQSLPCSVRDWIVSAMLFRDAKIVLAKHARS